MQRAVKSLMPGIPQKIKPRAMNARRMAPRLSCRFRGGSTFLGKMTPRCELIRIPGLRLVCCISAAQHPRTEHLNGKDTRQPLGRDSDPIPSVPAVVDLYGT